MSNQETVSIFYAVLRRVFSSVDERSRSVTLRLPVGCRSVHASLATLAGCCREFLTRPAPSLFHNSRRVATFFIIRDAFAQQVIFMACREKNVLNRLISWYVAKNFTQQTQFWAMSRKYFLNRLNNGRCRENVPPSGTHDLGEAKKNGCPEIQIGRF